MEKRRSLKFQLINEWILEYALIDIWEEFTNSQTYSLSNSTVKLITVLFEKKYCSCGLAEELLSFLMILCCLNDYKNFYRKPENGEASGIDCLPVLLRRIKVKVTSQDETLTPLEEIQIYWSNQFQKGEMQRIEERVFKHEAVHACLRQGMKQLARQVYDRVFTKEEENNDINGMVKSTKNMLEMGTDMLPLDMCNKIDDQIITYLKKVLDGYQTPIHCEGRIKTENSGQRNGQIDHCLQ
ncbi:hypothetical protein DPMN_067782, partial [Dreissena polymorpha]